MNSGSEKITPNSFQFHKTPDFVISKELPQKTADLDVLLPKEKMQ